MCVYSLHTIGFYSYSMNIKTNALKSLYSWSYMYADQYCKRDRSNRRVVCAVRGTNRVTTPGPLFNPPHPLDHIYPLFCDIFNSLVHNPDECPLNILSETIHHRTFTYMGTIFDILDVVVCGHQWPADHILSFFNHISSDFPLAICCFYHWIVHRKKSTAL